MLKDNQRDALRSFKRELKKDSRAARKARAEARQRDERTEWQRLRDECVTLRRG